MPHPTPSVPSPSPRKKRTAVSPTASYLIHRTACPAQSCTDGTQWRALAPLGSTRQIHEWLIPVECTSGDYHAHTPISMVLQQGAGLMRWRDESRQLQSALVPGDVLSFPAGTRFQFEERAISAAVFFVTGECTLASLPKSPR